MGADQPDPPDGPAPKPDTVLPVLSPSLSPPFFPSIGATISRHSLSLSLSLSRRDQLSDAISTSTEKAGNLGFFFLKPQSGEFDRNGEDSAARLQRKGNRRLEPQMSQSGKLMPNLDHQSTKLLNLTVLQRLDPFVEEILITAAHVTFYEFNIDSSQWSRKDVEGSLFVVKRNTQPRFQFIVMNRRNTDNLVENLLEDFEFEVQVPYLLYRNAAQEVNGIWFYNARECEEVASLFNRILNAYSKVPQKSKVPTTKSEFEELEAVPTMAVMDGPLEPPSSTIPNVNDVHDDPAFVNFFSSALNIGGATNVAGSGQPFPSSSAMAPPPCPVSASSPAVSTLQIPSPPVAAPTPLGSLLDNNDPGINKNRAANLVKPSFFIPPPSSSAAIVPPVSSSMPTAPPLHPPVNLQRPYGAPILQPFPPPTPPPSLTPTAVPTANYAPVINRDKVRDALSVLVQDNQFIDMVYRALLNAHNS